VSMTAVSITPGGEGFMALSLSAREPGCVILDGEIPGTSGDRKVHITGYAHRMTCHGRMADNVIS
jgi:hypothetical protein